MSFDTLQEIEDEAQRYGAGQLYWTIVQLVNDQEEADAICREHGIYQAGRPDQEKALLKKKFGACMDDRLVDRICGRKVPLVVAALALIGLSRCIHNRRSKECAAPAESLRKTTPVASTPLVAVLALVISSRKLGSYQEAVRDLSTKEILELVNIATFFRCMSKSSFQQLLRDIELRDGFSAEDEEDVLACLEVTDGADLIEVHSRYELKNRLQEGGGSVSIVKLGAIGNSLGLKGFTA